MKRKNLFLIIGIVGLILIALSPVIITEKVTDQEIGKDLTFLGLELEKILSLINGIIALILFIITFISYKRDGRIRLLYVSTAFLIFAIKSFLVYSEIFFLSLYWIDPVSIVLELGVLLLFFFGVIKKRG